MSFKINVLNMGYIALVDHMGSDLSVVRSARVSYDADWRTGEDTGSDYRLISYLMKNKHTSPFESCMFTFEVKAPIFVLRQWQRHRTWSFNEVSARYTELPEGYYFPKKEDITEPSKVNKQCRTETETENSQEIKDLLSRSQFGANVDYRKLLNLGCPRELARVVLPMGTYSRMIATVNLHNLMRFLILRLSSHSQKEIRLYAEAALTLAEDIVPVSIAAFREHSLKDLL